jgi:hypothetical protein
MGRQSNFAKAISARSRVAELAVQTELQDRIAAGPPVGSGISFDGWLSWNKYGWVVCPRTKWTCSDPQCGVGSSCQAMAAFGLAGDGTQLAYGRRPTCGATNRQGRSCGNKAVPGKRRCRFHGGLSTGPRTVEGRARIASAQKLRWAKFRSRGVPNETPEAVNCPTPTKPEPSLVDRYQEAEDEMTPNSFMTL